MRNLILAGAIAILAAPASIDAQTPGTPPADPTGSNTAGANADPTQPMPNAGSATGDTSGPMTSGAPSTATTPPPSSDAGSMPSAMPDTSTNASPPPDAGMKTYPLCSKTVHDECRNRGGK